MLTETQRKAREGNFTASMAPVLMGDDAERLLEIWRVAIGDLPEVEANWPMALGSYCEPFILDWHQNKIGEPLVRRGEVVKHPQRPNVSATLDAYRASDDSVIDAKVCGGWQKLDDIVAYYTPQIIVQQRCVGTARGLLLVMHGTAEPKEYPVTFDASYENTLWERVAAFQLCVATFTPPVPLPKVTPPEQYRRIELNPEDPASWPNWGTEMTDHLLIWDSTKAESDMHAEATKKVKQLLPEDVGHLRHGATVITRNRAGAVSIKRG